MKVFVSKKKKKTDILAAADLSLAPRMLKHKDTDNDKDIEKDQRQRQRLGRKQNEEESKEMRLDEVCLCAKPPPFIVSCCVFASSFLDE